jgi:hypothetical protein
MIAYRSRDRGHRPYCSGKDGRSGNSQLADHRVWAGQRSAVLRNDEPGTVGWVSTLERYKKSKSIAQEQKNEEFYTVGELLGG